MPRHDEGYVPAPKTRVVPCADCQAGIEVGWKRRTPARCVDCAERAQIESILGMHNRTGPYYEKWARKMTAFLTRELGGYLGDAANHPDANSSNLMLGSPCRIHVRPRCTLGLYLRSLGASKVPKRARGIEKEVSDACEVYA